MPFPQGQMTFSQAYIPQPQASLIGVNLNTVRDVVQELYEPGLCQVECPEFHKPYPDMIDRDNLYPRGYKVPEFSLFFEKNGQSTLEHIAHFTIQCGELANFENFSNFKLRLFPNSLTGNAFTWYATLPRNSVLTWQEMER